MAGTKAPSQPRSKSAGRAPQGGQMSGGYPDSKAQMRKASVTTSQYSFHHIPGYSGHAPENNRNSGKVGKSFNNETRHVSRFRTEAGQIGLGARAASEVKEQTWNRQHFESHHARNQEAMPTGFVHREGYSGHLPASPQNMRQYGKTFGTELSEW
eukprot:CAMPEP_0206464768 /NCGR_PEP_ID=MMETSP0324_2-20121206/27415_1 /ASSEMBLY_ACC=CAM_ASM_000836 /TAXON_ID=2866 /ORGANISM="Crypthecodinium cohnii, Strain Seligo" /LENGTH=154 /DNA_ID=CAMNT_0053937467 /DNA_START=79 /DNA_END=540 /DNA_ORIENTATION=+